MSSSVMTDAIREEDENNQHSTNSQQSPGIYNVLVMVVSDTDGTLRLLLGKLVNDGHLL
jgi:hypothetical protein